MRIKAYAIVVALAWSGVFFSQTMRAQETTPVSTPEQYDELMKKVGSANSAAGKAAQSSGWAEVRTQLAVLAQALADAQPFWELHEKEDALKALADTRAKVAAAIELAAVESPDPAAFTAAIKDVGTGCRSCHMTYRENVDGDSHIKPGSLD